MVVSRGGLAPMNCVMSRVPDFSKLPFALARVQFEDVRAGPWLTPEGIGVAPVYRASDIAGLDCLDSLPGIAPYVRGPYAAMYVERPWTIRQYAGYSSAEESNAFYRRNLAAGQKGLSVAFDLPTCRLVDVEPRLHKDQVRASVLRRHGRHCRAHPERPGLVARGRDDATLARPADRNRFAAQLRIVATADFPDLFVANSCHAVFGLLLPSCLSELWAILSRRLGRRAFPGMDYPTPWKKFRQRHLKLSHRRARERDRHSAMNSCASSAKGFAGAGLVFGT
jgi:hypothetical protein